MLMSTLLKFDGFVWLSVVGSLFSQDLLEWQWLVQEMLLLMQEHCSLLHFPLHLHLLTVNLFDELI